MGEVRFQEVFMLADIILIPGKCKKCRKQGYVIENNLLCIKCAGKMVIKRLKSNNMPLRRTKYELLE